MGNDANNLPGFGAERMASRAERRVERLEAEKKLGDPTDEVLRKIEQANRTRRTYSQGAEGERMVAQVLGFLGQFGWVALHDLRWPGRQRANVDHIAVGPGGVIIIDAKNWTGNVVVSSDGLRQNGYSRTNQVAAVAQSMNDVAALLAPEHRLAAHGILALVAQDEAPTEVAGVTVVGRTHLPAYLVGLPVKLSPYHVADVARFLARELAPRTGGAPMTPAGAAARLPRTPRRTGTSGGRTDSPRRPSKPRGSDCPQPEVRTSKRKPSGRSNRRRRRNRSQPGDGAMLVALLGAIGWYAFVR